ncbi:hypothetical protein GDO78_014855 [Eleutherodactylus coqui]|uniref:Uncharacterized protein n=1 Tax=Eleutherodactylus coqui TaxID=57060 RepID=A0A8J6EED7_ELECQ|nr:hypothetical protein GDO78_014855 [Eleutherodactylus coqui]
MILSWMAFTFAGPPAPEASDISSWICCAPLPWRSRNLMLVLCSSTLTVFGDATMFTLDREKKIVQNRRWLIFASLNIDK